MATVTTQSALPPATMIGTLYLSFELGRPRGSLPSPPGSRNGRGAA